jgi:hypothetical protein
MRLKKNLLSPREVFALRTYTSGQLLLQFRDFWLPLLWERQQVNTVPRALILCRRSRRLAQTKDIFFDFKLHNSLNWIKNNPNILQVKPQSTTEKITSFRTPYKTTAGAHIPCYRFKQFLISHNQDTTAGAFIPRIRI